MKFFNQLFKPFVSIQEYEANIKNQGKAVSHFLSVFNFASADEGKYFSSVDFFFTGNNPRSIESLSTELKKKDYELFGVTKQSDNHYILSGTTPRMEINETAFHHWVKQMNEIGFIHDCLFDGWGLLGKMDK